MQIAEYEVISRGGHWFVCHDSDEAGPYATKEAALQAAVPPISLSAAEGLEIHLRIEGGIKTPDPQMTDN